MAGTALQLGSFRFDVTPPAGHALCGGLIAPIRRVDDALEAVGLVLQCAGEPIVVKGGVKSYRIAVRHRRSGTMPR